MTTKPNLIPARRITSIPDTRTSTVDSVLSAVKEWIETREGAVGDGMDRAVTVRDLLNSGIGDATNWQFLFPGGGIPGIPSQLPTDAAMPPTPTNLQAVGTMKNIILTWDFPRTYRRLAYFEVWRSLTDAIGNAVQVIQTIATVAADTVGEGQTYYYWVRAVSDAPMTSPFNKLEGTLGTTGFSPEFLLELLTGRITEEQLFVDLGDRIDLIDAPATTVGSVSRRILDASDSLDAKIVVERDARVDADATITLSIEAQASRIGDAEAAILEESSTRATAISAEAQQRNEQLTTYDGTIRSYIQSYSYSRATSDSTFNTVYSTLRSEFAAADNNTLTSAQSYVQTYAYTKAATDTAIATSTSQVTARLNNIDGVTLEQKFTAQANTNTGLLGQYTVKIDSNGYSTGFGLASTAVNGTTVSAFAVRSDSFYIASPEGPGVTPALPFIVRTSPVTINGVTVPVGVYITEAFIANGSISNAKIGNAAIDDAKIVSLSAVKITSGFLDAARIDVGSLHANRITAGTITADRIAAFAIGADQIAANSITAGKISVASLSAISAVVGVLRTRTDNGGGGVEIRDNKIQVFNDSNVEMVRVGYLL